MVAKQGAAWLVRRWSVVGLTVVLVAGLGPPAMARQPEPGCGAGPLVAADEEAASDAAAGSPGSP